MSSILIRNGIIVPMDSSRGTIENGYVAIEGNRISSVGRTDELDKNKKSDIIIDANGKAVLPGFVNAHTHLATECFRGIVEIFPEMHFTFVVKNFLKETHLYDLSLLGAMELIRFGTTCTGDNYQKSTIIAQAVADSGLRAVISEQISQADLQTGVYPAIFTYQPEDAERQIRANEDLVRKWNGSQNGRITCVFGPHAPDTLTVDILNDIKNKSKEHGVGISIHIAQSVRELQVMRQRHRMTSVEYLNKAGILGPNTIGAHCVYLTSDDIRILKESKTNIAHCPNNFIKRGQKTPLMPWLRGGIKSIGLASDNILHDPFELMRFMNYLALQYAEQIDPSLLHLVPSPYETLEMATMGSARALGLGKEVGSIEAGKKADVIIVDLKKPHLTPNLDTITNLVHYANGNDVETTIVDGKIVMDSREIKTVNETEVLRKGQNASEEVWQGFSKEFRQFPDVADKFRYFR